VFDGVATLLRLGGHLPELGVIAKRLPVLLRRLHAHRLSGEEIRLWQVHLRDTRRVSWSAFNIAMCALRFFYREVAIYFSRSRSMFFDPDQHLIDPDQHLIDPGQLLIDPDQHLIDPDQHFVDPDQHLIDPDQHLIDPDLLLIDPDQHFVDPDQHLIDPDLLLIDPDLFFLIAIYFFRSRCIRDWPMSFSIPATRKP
jgi:hypothetical protein